MSGILKFIQTIVLFLVLFYGGLGKENYTFLSLTILWLTATFLILALRNKQINFPSGFYLYGLFLIFFALNLFWSKDFWITFWYLLLFSIGFLFWVISYNLKNKFKDHENIIVILGIIFGILSIINILGYIPSNANSFSIYKFASKDHLHIGDFWAIILSVFTAKLIMKSVKKTLWLVLIILGVFFLYLSQSRTAFLTLIVGISYLLNNLPSNKKYLLSLSFLILLAVGLFLIYGRTKPTILSRGYYLQAIVGFLKYPLGVGIGNFGSISANQSTHIFGFREFSSVAINIILEMFAGIGIFAFIFLLWFLKALASVLENSDGERLITRVIFLTLTVNFMFDFTYFIPTMLWLWFISLGLSQN